MVVIAGPVVVEDLCGCVCADDALLVVVVITGPAAVANLGVGGVSIL